MVKSSARKQSRLVVSNSGYLDAQNAMMNSIGPLSYGLRVKKPTINCGWDVMCISFMSQDLEGVGRGIIQFLCIWKSNMAQLIFQFKCPVAGGFRVWLPEGTVPSQKWFNEYPAGQSTSQKSKLNQQGQRGYKNYPGCLCLFPIKRGARVLLGVSQLT